MNPITCSSTHTDNDYDNKNLFSVIMSRFTWDFFLSFFHHSCLEIGFCSAKKIKCVRKLSHFIQIDLSSAVTTGSVCSRFLFRNNRRIYRVPRPRATEVAVDKWITLREISFGIRVDVIKCKRRRREDDRHTQLRFVEHIQVRRGCDCVIVSMQRSKWEWMANLYEFYCGSYELFVMDWLIRRWSMRRRLAECQHKLMCSPPAAPPQDTM